MISSDIEDMSLEISDLGYNVDISYYKDEVHGDILSIKLDYNNTAFCFTPDIRYFVLRTYQYMRELGWYSNLSINSGASKKKIYITPTERIRTEDLITIDDNWPQVLSIFMQFYK